MQGYIERYWTQTRCMQGNTKRYWTVVKPVDYTTKFQLTLEFSPHHLTSLIYQYGPCKCKAKLTHQIYTTHPTHTTQNNYTHTHTHTHTSSHSHTSHSHTTHHTHSVHHTCTQNSLHLHTVWQLTLTTVTQKKSTINSHCNHISK